MKMFVPGQSVRDADDEGIVVKVTARSVRVYFVKLGVVDYLRPLTNTSIIPEGVKTAEDLESVSSAQGLAILLLQMVLEKRSFSYQDGQFSVLEGEKVLTIPADNMSEAVEALEVFLC